MPNNITNEIITLYHGTTPDYAKLLLQHGWKPNQVKSGSNCGQSKYLYLSTHPEDALWFSQEKGCNVVLEVRVPKSSLKVDPEDGYFLSVEEEIASTNGTPGKVVLFKELAKDSFSNHTI